METRLPSNPRCDRLHMRHLAIGGYFQSHNKDGGHAVAENLVLHGMHAHFTALCVTDAQLLAIEFSHCGDPDSCWHSGFRCKNTGWLWTFFAPVALTLT